MRTLLLLRGTMGAGKINIYRTKQSSTIYIVSRPNSSSGFQSMSNKDGSFTITQQNDKNGLGYFNGIFGKKNAKRSIYCN